MPVVLLLWRARLRRAWRPIAVLAALFAIGGGIALAVGAGARRTADADDAVGRLANSLDVGVGYGSHDPAQVERLVSEQPGVRAAEQHVGFLGSVRDVPPGSILFFFGTWHDPPRVDRPIVLDGRYPTAPDEAFLNEAAVTRSGLRVGDRVTFVVANTDFSEFDPVELTISGTGLLADEVVEDETGSKPGLLLHRGFVETHIPWVAWGNAQIELQPGANAGDVLQGLARHGLFPDEDIAEDRRRVDEAMRPLVTTLSALSLLAGFAVVVIVTQAVARLGRRGPADERSLRAAGCDRRQMLGVEVLTAATVGVLGSIGAACVAFLASPLFPVGQVRRIRPLRGFDFDAPLLVGGGALLALALAAVVALVAVTSWRGAGRGPRPSRPRAIPSALTGKPAMTAGVRFASGRRGAAATIAGIAAGLCVVVAATSFIGSVTRLLDDPGLAGFDWDVMGRTSFSAVDTDQMSAAIRDDPAVSRASGLGFAGGSIRGEPVPIGIWRALRGSPWPPLVRGRTPQGPDEVLAGEATLDRTGVDVGDTVELRLEFTFAREPGVAKATRVTVVGTAVSPTINLPGTDTPGLDEGVLVRYEDIQRVAAAAARSEVILFDLAEGSSVAELRRRFPDGFPNELRGPTEWLTSARPAELSQAGSARTTIALAVLALLVALVGVNIHSLLGFVRQRGRAYAVLKALGFTPREVRSSVFWQSAVVVAIGTVIAAPIGFAAGRWLINGFADRLGVVSPSTFPVAVVALTGVVAFALLQVAATLPAFRASRVSAGADLRAE